MFDFIRKKQLNRAIFDLHSKIDHTSTKVSNDIKILQQWINHHHAHIKLTKTDIEEMKKWLHHLYQHTNSLHNHVQQFNKNIIELHKNDQEILERIQKLEQGQLRTLQRTSQGQVKDKSLKIKDKSITQKKPEIAYINKDQLTGSELELVRLLYQTEKPLSYTNMAKYVGKKTKSIRNLIYQIREKGVQVHSKPVGIRTQGFYLPREEKIKVSGR